METLVEVIVKAKFNEETGDYFVSVGEHPTEIIRGKDCIYFKEAPLLTYCELKSVFSLKFPTSKFCFCDKAIRKSG